MKRFFDLIVSALALLILFPFFFLISILIKFTSPGPIFYRARRVGKDGVFFRLFKFRTMIAKADQQGPGVTSAGDTRITTSGRFLRRTKIDELPQLINVLKGEMSLVGPRPEDPCYVALYTPDQREVLRVSPGITSAASLAFRHEEAMLSGPDWETRYREEMLPAKLAIDLAYLERRTLWTDFVLILRTVAAMFR